MDNKDHILNILTTLLGHLKINVTDIVADVVPETHSLYFAVHTPDSALLIGEHGANLAALSHLMKRIVEKQIPGEHISFTVDVNDYQKKRTEDVRAKAHILAERARHFKSSVEMDPMSSYERMIVHSLFTETKDIVTESVGVGKERHIVIKYTESKSPSHTQEDSQI